MDHDVDLWIDYQQLQGTLFQEIADAIHHSVLFIACVSDEYVTAQNCLREFRFASALQITKILCVVGKGDKWQKSEINLLSLDASTYNFQTKSKDNFQNFLKKVQSILKSKLPNLNEHKKQQSMIKDEKAAVEKNLSAYKEMGELAQRKILQQANFIATKLRFSDVSMNIPYPRIFYVDFCNKSTKADPNKQANPQSAKRPRTASRSNPATDGVWANIDFADMCFKWLCETEGVLPVYQTSKQNDHFLRFRDGTLQADP